MLVFTWNTSTLSFEDVNLYASDKIVHAPLLHLMISRFMSSKECLKMPQNKTGKTSQDFLTESTASDIMSGGVRE